MAKDPGTPRLLSGGNPQIPKGEGDGPVQAYIAALPGWKQEVAVELDRLVGDTVPGVAKAVKWNSPFYGVEPGRWFLSFHAFAGYLKLTFFDGTELDPVPPEPSKAARVRYAHLREGEALERARLASWIEQAARLPGERL